MVVCFANKSFGFLKKHSFFGCLLCKQKLRLRFDCASIALRFFKKTKFFWLFALQTKASVALWFFKKTKFFWLFALQTKASVALRAKQSKAKQSKAKQSKAKQSKAKQSKAKQIQKVVTLQLFVWHRLFRG